MSEKNVDRGGSPGRGLLISFEGIDGSGKSTQVQLLATHLREQGQEVCCVREPGGTEVSERIRTLLLDPSLSVDPMAELLLFSAARAQMVTERVLPALREGQVVICDRYYDSSTAYQGRGRRLADVEWIESLHHRATRGLIPDRTYLLQLDLETARERRAAESDDRMETARDEFYQRVINAYADLAEAHPKRFVQLDATASPEQIHQRIVRDLEPFLKKMAGTAPESDSSSE